MIDQSRETATRPVETSPNDGRVIAALCVASFLAALNFFGTAPFYPDIARDLDTTVPLVGQVTTMMILISTILGLAVGPIADRYGYRLMLVVGVIAIGVNLIGIGLAPSYFVMLGLSICGGLADALVFGLPLAIAGIRFTGAAQKKAMGWTIGSLSSASIIGTPILTTIGSVVGWRGALVGAGTVTMLAAWFVRASLPEDHRQAGTSLRVRDIASAYLPVIRHRPTLRLYVASALRSVTWIGFITYLGAFLAEGLDLGTRQVGLVYMMSGIGYAIGSVLSARVSVLSPRTTFSIATLIGAAVIAAVLVISVIPVSVSMVVVGSLTSAFAGLALATILVNESPAGTGTTMVLNGSMINLGASVGALIGGILISAGGYRALGVGLPVFSVAAAILALWPAHAKDAVQPTTA
jgi:predicted MFS family arabinose efflux permease